ncbi:MAG: hypothetical protein H6557_00575 [Lewinellaceae bacterium]|nr:hypothetical protein [Phaeodactylibacter sp.]MCB9035093.1 hypothetical protein [Lewinellaceae bacterium]
MFKKFAILIALVVAGALLSSAFAGVAVGKPIPIPAAEECAVSLSGGNTSLFPTLGGGGFSLAGILPTTFFAAQSFSTTLARTAQSVRLQAIKQPLFLLFHAFLFYDKF